jgi:hypothetical protein
MGLENQCHGLWGAQGEEEDGVGAAGGRAAEFVQGALGVGGCPGCRPPSRHRAAALITVRSGTQKATGSQLRICGET